MRRVAYFTEDEGNTRIYEDAAQVLERIAKEKINVRDGGDIDVLLTVTLTRPKDIGL